MSEDIDPEIQTALDNIKKDLTAIASRIYNIENETKKLYFSDKNLEAVVIKEIKEITMSYLIIETMLPQIENQYNYNKSEES